MNDFENYPFLACVKFDLIVKEFERQFNNYFDHHVRELAAKAGRAHGWRAREARDAPNFGLLEQEFWMIYQIDNPGLFKFSMPKGDYPPAPTEEMPFYRDVSNWT